MREVGGHAWVSHHSGGTPDDHQITDFADKALAMFTERITDEVFLMTQNDKELMHDYLRLVGEEGVDSVNRQIGRMVRQRFALTNAPERKAHPRSTLIHSHQQFE